MFFTLNISREPILTRVSRSNELQKYILLCKYMYVQRKIYTEEGILTIQYACSTVHLRHAHAYAYKRTTFLEGSRLGFSYIFLEFRFNLLFPILVYALICLLFASHYNIVNTSGIHAGSNKNFRGGVQGIIVSNPDHPL